MYNLFLDRLLTKIFLFFSSMCSLLKIFSRLINWNWWYVSEMFSFSYTDSIWSNLGSYNLSNQIVSVLWLNNKQFSVLHKKKQERTYRPRINFVKDSSAYRLQKEFANSSPSFGDGWLQIKTKSFCTEFRMENNFENCTSWEILHEKLGRISL